MTFRFDKLTIKAQEAVATAQSLATQAGNPQIEPLHLLAGLLQESDGIVRPLLQKIGVNQSQLDDGRIRASTVARASGGASPPVGQNLANVLQAAQDEADRMKDEFVSTEHLLLALTKVDTPAQASAANERRPRAGLADALQSIRGIGTGHRPELRRQNFRRWRSTASIWSNARRPENWIRSSAATRKSDA